MSLFTNPVVLTDGTDTHSFSFRAQLNDNKSVVGEWVEPAAALSAKSSIIVKHDESSASKRRLLQRKVMLPLTDPLESSMLTINFTVTHHSEHALADIEKQVNVVTDAIAEGGFVNNLLQGLI
jgi:citrate lyase alpha subunit